MARRWPWQDNPILKHELIVRLRAWDAVCLHGLFVIVCAGVVLYLWPPTTVSPLRAAARAQALRAVLVVTQFLLAAIVASVIAAPLIAREKEQRTYVLLLSTPLEPATLIFGKLAVALAYVLLLQLSVLPVLVTLSYLGGVDWQQLVGDVLLLMSASIVFATLQFAASMRQRRVLAAQVFGAGVVLAVSALLVLPLLWRFDRLGAAYYPAMRRIGQWTVPAFGLLALICVAAIYVAYRQRLLHPPDEDVTAPLADGTRPKKRPVGLVLDQRRWPDRWLVPPRRQSYLPDGVNPVLDRELRAELFSQGTSMLRALIQVSAAVSVVLMGVCLELVPKLAYVYCWFLLSFAVLITPAFAGGAIAGERERGTFDLLRCTLLKPHHVLFGKMYVAVRTVLALMLLVSVVQVALPTVLVALPLKLNYGGFLVALLVVYIQVPVIVSVAFLWSVLLPRAAWATLATYLTVVVAYAGIEWAAQGLPPDALPSRIAPFRVAYALILGGGGVELSELARYALTNLAAWGTLGALSTGCAYALFGRHWYDGW